MGMGPSGCHDRLRAWSRVVAAGCGFILDRNWGSKNSYLIDGVAHRGSLSRVMGLAGKPKEFAGAEVERYFREGKIKEVADYCETDIVSTYQIWLRYELFRGTLSQSTFEASERNLANFLNARSS